MGESAIVAIPDLVEVLKDSDKEVSEKSATTLIEISKKSKEMQGSLSSSELDKAISGFEQALKLLANEKDKSDKIQENLTSLINEKNHRLWNLVVKQIKSHPWLLSLLAIPVFLIVYYITLCLSPLLLLLFPSEMLGKFKIPIGLLLQLKYHPRVLNAWVSKYLSSSTSTSTEQYGARILFWNNATANLHRPSRYIPLPLRIETNSQPRRHENLPLELLQEIFQQNTARLLIYGKGGIGKTSLACKLAESAMADEPSQRLHKKHSLLPVLIEPEQIEYELKLNMPMPVETTRKDGDNSYKTLDTVTSQPFIEAIRKQLQNLIKEASPINDELLKQLLQSGRILVIVDRFSEMSEDARQTIDPDSKTYPINALIVTSRKRETFGNIKMALIEPLQLTGSELMRFMEEYFQKEKEVPLKQQPLLYQACNNLQNIVKLYDNRAIITVLLAKLTADQLIAGRSLPTSIPNLISNSLNLINDQFDTQGFKPTNNTICSDMQLIAWTCLQSTFRPNAATLDNVTRTLKKLDPKNEPYSKLNYLIDGLRVVERVGNEKDHIRIVHDPMAEYLAGLHLVKIYANDTNKWKNFLKRADEFEKTKTQGFMLAVYDCCRVACCENVVSLFKQHIHQIVKDESDS